MTDNLTQQILERYARGFAYGEIAAELGVSYHVVRGRVRRNRENISVLDSRYEFVDWRNAFNAISEMKRVYEDANYWDDKNVTISVRDCSPAIVVITSDWHLGAPTCDVNALKSDVIEWLDTDNLYVIVSGDMIENGVFTQGVQSATEQILSPELQHLVIRDILSELHEKEKLIAVLSGNHEERSGRALFETFRFVVDGLDVATFGNKGVLKLRVDDTEYVIFVGHKLPGKTATNPFGAHLRVLKEIVVPDISNISHVHDWNYALISMYGNEVHVGTNGSYVNEQYAVRNYNTSLQKRNHYYVLSNKHKDIKHFDNLQDAVTYRETATAKGEGNSFPTF